MEAAYLALPPSRNICRNWSFCKNDLAFSVFNPHSPTRPSHSAPFSLTRTHSPRLAAGRRCRAPLSSRLSPRLSAVAAAGLLSALASPLCPRRVASPRFSVPAKKLNFLLQAGDESPDLASARKDTVAARRDTPDTVAAAAGHLRGAAAGRRISLQHPSPPPSSWRRWTQDPKLPSTTRCCYGQEEVLPRTTKCCYGQEEVRPRRRTTQEQTNKMHLEWRVVAVLGWSVDTAPIWFDEVVDDVLWEQETGIWSRQSGACCCCSCSRTTAAAARRGELRRPGGQVKLFDGMQEFFVHFHCPNAQRGAVDENVGLEIQNIQEVVGGLVLLQSILGKEQPEQSIMRDYVCFMLYREPDGCPKQRVNVVNISAGGAMTTEDKLVGGHLAGSMNILYMYNTSSVGNRRAGRSISIHIPAPSSSHAAAYLSQPPQSASLFVAHVKRGRASDGNVRTAARSGALSRLHLIPSGHHFSTISCEIDAVLCCLQGGLHFTLVSGCVDSTAA